jgi:hypothetical protein
MRIQALFATRTYSEVPELVAAWDEYTIEGWPEGWENEKRASLAKMEDDLDTHIEVTLEVSQPQLEILLSGRNKIYTTMLNPDSHTEAPQ